MEGPFHERDDVPWMGPYTALGRLGYGGTGVVYRAAAPDGREVAVKVLRPGVVRDAVARRRLARDVEALRRVRHPHIAEVVDADMTADLPYIVTRYMPGRPLREVVEETGPLTGDRLRRVAAGSASALAAIHAAGLVHGDLHPGNVLIADGEPVLIDVGGFQPAGPTPLTTTGFDGAIGYVAPEVLQGEDAGSPSDVFAWATSMIFASTGRPPFGSGPIEAVLFRTIQGKPDLGGVPDGLLPLLRTAMTPDPAERPGAAGLEERVHHVDLTPPADSDPPADVNRPEISFGPTSDPSPLSWHRQPALPPTPPQPPAPFAQAPAQPLANAPAPAALGDSLSPAAPSIAFPRHGWNRKASQASAMRLVGRPVPPAWRPAEAGELRAPGWAAAPVRRRLLALPVITGAALVTLLPAIAGWGGAALTGLSLSVAIMVVAAGGYARWAADRVAGRLNVQARARLDEGLHGEAVRLLSGPARAWPRRHPATVAAAGNLAVALHGLGRTAEAEDVLREAAARSPRSARARLEVTRTALRHLRERLEPESFRAVLDEVRRGRGGRGRRGGVSAAAVAARGNLAVALRDAGRTEEAAAEAAEALAEARAHLGPDAPETVALEVNLGALRRDLGDLPEAERLLREAADRSVRALGAEHPRTLAAQSGLAAVLAGTGRAGEALMVLQRVQEVRTRVLGADHPDTLRTGNDLGHLHLNLGRRRRAAAIFRHVLDTGNARGPRTAARVRAEIDGRARAGLAAAGGEDA